MISRIPLERIKDNPFQTRQAYDDVGDLAESILKMKGSRPESLGLIQVPPARIVVGDRVLDPERYGGVTACLVDEPDARVELAAGHRRLRAFQHLHDAGDEDYEAFPVEVMVLSDQEMADIAWAENAQREDLSPIEEARAIQQAVEQFGWTQREVAKRWGLKSQSAVANKLRLLQLPDQVQEMIKDGRMPERHARELLPLVQIGKDPQAATGLAQRAMRNEWTAERLSSEVKAHLNRITQAISQEILNWDDWGEQTLPDGCTSTCEACEHRARDRCPKPDQYEAKLKAWKDRLLQQAKDKTGLPVVEGSEWGPVLSAEVLERARERQCPNLGVAYRPRTYSGSSVRVDDALPGVYYVCKQDYRCDCQKVQERSDDQVQEGQAEVAAPKKLDIPPKTSDEPKKLDMPPKTPPVVVVAIRIPQDGDNGSALSKFTLSIGKEGDGFPRLYRGSFEEMAEVLQRACDEFFAPGGGPESPDGGEVVAEAEVIAETEVVQ